MGISSRLCPPLSIQIVTDSLSLLSVDCLEGSGKTRRLHMVFTAIQKAAEWPKPNLAASHEGKYLYPYILTYLHHTRLKADISEKLSEGTLGQGQSKCSVKHHLHQDFVFVSAQGIHDLLHLVFQRLFWERWCLEDVFHLFYDRLEKKLNKPDGI